MTPPPTIHILSDGNLLEYAGIVTALVSKQKFYQYVYVVSDTKLGETLSLNEEDLQKIIKTNTP